MKIKATGSNYLKLENDQKIIENSWLLEDGKSIKFDDNCKTAGDLLPKHLDFLTNYPLSKEILLVACGSKFIIPTFEIRSYIHSLNFKLEWMITPSAVHTWNMLIEDNRSVVGLFFLN